MNRRIGAAHVVGRVDQSLAEELGPDPVGRGPSEVGVVGGGHPGGQRLARIFVGGDGHGLAVQQPRLDRLFGPEMNDLAFGIDRDGRAYPSSRRRPPPPRWTLAKNDARPK